MLVLTLPDELGSSDGRGGTWSPDAPRPRREAAQLFRRDVRALVLVSQRLDFEFGCGLLLCLASRAISDCRFSCLRFRRFVGLRVRAAAGGVTTAGATGCTSTRNPSLTCGRRAWHVHSACGQQGAASLNNSRESLPCGPIVLQAVCVRCRRRSRLRSQRACFVTKPCASLLRAIS